MSLINMKRAAVFGSGAFGTALATAIARQTESVSVWHINANEAATIEAQRENSFFLKGVRLPDNVHFTADVKRALDGAEVLLFVIPTQFLRGFLERWAPLLRDHIRQRSTPVVMCSKGIERSTLKFPGQVLEEFLPGCHVAVLAGPSFAIEVAQKSFTNICIASPDINEARNLQRMLTTPDRLLRYWASTDAIGCEVASAMKNVLAIASGIAKGLGMGNNARATLISRGLLEIRDVTLALGGRGEAVFGLAGLGDLLLTCSSELSRNFSFGLKLGQGMTVEEIQRNAKAVSEGVATAEPLFRLAKRYGVCIPICEQVYRVIYEKKSAKQCFEELRDCPLQDEGLPPLVQTAARQAKL